MAISKPLAFDQSTLGLMAYADDIAVLGNIREMAMKLSKKCMEATNKR